MTSTTRYSTWLFILFTLLLPYFATAQQSGNDSITETLIKKMALKYQLSETPQEIRAQFEQNPFHISSAANEQMLQQFDDAYRTDRMLEDFKNALHQKITDQYRQELSQWLNNDYTQSITDARQFYYTLQGKRQRVINRYEMEQNPPSDQRTNLISQLTDTTSVAESSVESSVIILKSIIKASSQLSDKRNFSDAQVDAIANNFRTQLQAQAGGQLNQEQLVMYHRLPDQALENYISFWGTNTGQWLDRAISQSLQIAYQQAADRFLQSISSN